ncbi:MAG: HPF/RaiA family ribosome-associated protein [Candidatus Levybacteria bacterium]|nr:HPF/RaiA family ribosome-associated protein [Candidatus Levybacteria bacterium]
MKYRITTKGFLLTAIEKQHIEKKIEKISRRLTSFESSLPILAIFIKKHEKKHHFGGSMVLTLPKKPLVVNFGGADIESTIQIAFDSLIRAVEVYKGKHFSSNSLYFDKRSLRHSL